MSEFTTRFDGFATLSPPVPGLGPITDLMFEKGRLVACRDGVTYELDDGAWREIFRDGRDG